MLEICSLVAIGNGHPVHLVDQSIFGFLGLRQYFVLMEENSLQLEDELVLKSNGGLVICQLGLQTSDFVLAVNSRQKEPQPRRLRDFIENLFILGILGFTKTLLELVIVVASTRKLTLVAGVGSIQLSLQPLHFELEAPLQPSLMSSLGL